jgi:hypothetical protein
VQRDEQRRGGERAPELRAAGQYSAEVRPDNDRDDDIERRPLAENPPSGDPPYCFASLALTRSGPIFCRVA